MALTKISTAMISQSAAAVDLNVDAGTFYVDTTNNRVGVGGKTDPDTPLHVIGTATATLFAGSGASLTSIPNSALVNSSITINSTAVSLGGSLTLTTANIAENTNLYYTNARADARIAAADTDDLSEGSSNLYYTDARVDARVSGGSLGNITTTGYIRGPATFTLDPAAHGDNTGTVVIAGNLQVDGVTTTINSTTLTVDDKNITLASGSANAAAASGAGFTVDIGSGTNPAITYDGTNDEWDFNKSLHISGAAGSGVKINSGGAIVGGGATGGDTQLMYWGGGPVYYGRSNSGGTVSGHEFRVGGVTKLNVNSSGNTIASGSVGIGTSSPSSFHANANNLVVGSGSGTEGITINSGAANYGVIYFADGTSGSAAYAGSINYNHADNSMRLGTNGSTTDVVIDSSGNVGIGTDSPDYPLHISGTGSQRLRIQKTDAGGDADLQLYSPSDSTQWILFGDSTSGNNSGVIKYVHSTNKMHFRTNDVNDRLVISSDGNVGIGTDSPASLLHAKQAGKTEIITESVGDYFPSTSIKRTGGSSKTNYHWEFQIGSSGFLNFKDKTNSYYPIMLNTTGDVLLGNDTSGSNATMFVDQSTARVGIGTSSPNTNVQIYHATDDVSINVNHGTGGSYPKKSGISFGATSTSLGGDATFTGGAGIQAINTAASNNLTEMAFFTTSGGAPTERMRIDELGNVGIGTASPDALLEISHDATSHNPVLRLTGTDTGAYAAGIEWYSGYGPKLSAQMFSTASGGQGGEFWLNVRDQSTNALARRMYVRNNGNVAFGDEGAPARSIVVKSADSVTNSIQFQSPTTGNAAGDGVGMGMDSTRKAFLWNYEGNDVYLGGDSSGVAMTIDGGSGKIGIGTDDPAAPLHIQFSNNDGGVGGHLIKNTNTGTTSNFASLSTQAVNGTIQGTFGSAHYSTWGNAVVFAGSQSNHPFKILSGNAVRATFDTSGRLAINQDPLANNFALQVTGLGGGSGDARAVYLKGAGAHTSIGGTGPTLVLQNTNSTANNIVKLSFESASSGETVSINAINTNHSSHYGDMAFNTRGSGGYSEKMRIMANGNVGIGEPNPGQKLQVNGNIRADGHYYVGGSIVIDSSRNITGASFTDGYITWSLAQLNRYGSNIELQYTPTNASTTVKIGANGSNPTIFNAYTGVATFSGNVGIGMTPSGSYKLEVNGETKSLGLVSAGTTNLGTNGGSNISDKTLLAGYGVLAGNGVRYGNYGNLTFRSSSGYTAGARSFLITNGYDANKFAIIQSTTHTTIPDIDGAGGGASNGEPRFVIDNSGLIGIGGVTGPVASLDLLGKFNVQNGQVWNETTQGVNTGSIHIDPNSGTDHAGGSITFGASDSGSGTSAQAGIYVRSDGSYGTKMYLSTCDSYAQGSKTAIAIMHGGEVLQPRQSRFQAYGGSTGYNPLTYSHSVKFPSTSYNIGSDYSGTTGLYTAPYDGYYIFEASIYSTSTASNGWGQAWLTINGGRGNFTDVFSNTGSNGGGVSIITTIHTIYLSQGDTVGYHPYTSSGSGYAFHNNAHHTWFRGRLIG